MLLVIHNLPSNTRYADIKALIKEHCGLTDLIVDNLVSEGPNKKVTVGLADEADGNLVMNKINGLYVGSDRLFVEHAKQRKSNQSFGQSDPSNNDFNAAQYNQYQQLYNGQMFYGQPQNAQFFPQFMPMDPTQAAQMAQQNFGMPFYMSAQNPNVGTNLQYGQQIQYPQLQGPMSSDSYSGQDYGANRNYEGNRDRSRSPNRGPEKERGARRSPSRWDESNRNDRYDEERPYNDKTYQDRSRTYQNQGNGSSNRYEKNYHQPEPNWDSRYDDSGFSRQSESIYAYKRRKFERRYQEKEPPRFREDRYSRYSRDSDTFPRKKKYPFNDNNKFEPQNKKVRGNQQYESRGKLENSGGRFPNKRASIPPHDKSNFFNKMAQRPMPPPKKKSKKGAGFVAPPNPPKDVAIRYEGWLCQASGVISHQIMKNVECEQMHKRHPIIRKLKACVRSRIDVITGEGMTMKLNDMLKSYREKFPEKNDCLFYQAVVEKVDQAEIEEFEKELNAARVAGGQVPNVKDERKPAKPVEKPKSKKPVTQLPPVQLPTEVITTPAGKLPKYPGANKKLQSALKKVQRDELAKDNIYTMDDLQEKALEKELDVFWTIYKEEVEKAEDDVEKSIGNFLNETVLPNIKKLTSLMVKKRVLDIRTNLAVRVYCYPKRPKGLDEFLKEHGVLSIKRSQMKKRLYIATCDTYESYDALCKRGSVNIESMTVQFKPLHSLKMDNSSKKNKNQNDQNSSKVTDEDLEGEDDNEEEGEGGDDGEVDDDDEGENDGDGGDDEEGDVIEVPVNADEANEEKTDSDAPNSDVIVVEGCHNHSAETIIIEDDTAKNRDSDVNISNETGQVNDDVMIVENQADREVINVEGKEPAVEGTEKSNAAKVIAERSEQADDGWNGAGEEWDGTGEAWDDAPAGAEATKGADEQQDLNTAAVDISADDLEDF